MPTGMYKREESFEYRGMRCYVWREHRLDLQTRKAVWRVNAERTVGDGRYFVEVKPWKAESRFLTLADAHEGARKCVDELIDCLGEIAGAWGNES